MPSLPTDLQTVTALAEEAGALLMRYWRQDLTVEHKTSPDDPVTQADREASALLIRGLKAAFPGDAVLSEEDEDDPERLKHRRVWIIDPIDGTKEFIEGTPEFCVSIGLCLDGEPVLGVIHAPATGEVWAGALGHGVWKNGERVQLSQRTEWITLVSDTEHRLELHRSGLPGMKPGGSVALKLARLASGEADATFSMSPRSEWDLAGGHALLAAQGGVLRLRDGRMPLYNQPHPHSRQGIIAGRPEVLEWLEGQLLAHQLPSCHLQLCPEEPAWRVLSTGQQAELRDHPGVCIRYSGQQLLALILLGPGLQQIERAEGDAHHLSRLTRDVVRGYGAALPSAHDPR